MKYILDIEDYNRSIERTKEIIFHTENGKEIRFVKASAEPEIIRCKDCKYWNELFPQCDRINKFGYGVNDFCSKAERRSDG